LNEKPYLPYPILWKNAITSESDTQKGAVMESRLMKQLIIIVVILFCWTFVILLVAPK